VQTDGTLSAFYDLDLLAVSKCSYRRRWFVIKLVGGIQMLRGVEALNETSRLNGGGPWQQQQQQQQAQRGAVMSNGSARMLLHVPAPPPARDRFRGVIAGNDYRPSTVGRGKST